MHDINLLPTGNYASLILAHVKARPSQTALVIPQQWTDTNIESESLVTYGQLGKEIASIRRGLHVRGFKAGDRIVVLFPVCIDLYALIIALLASGLVAVFIDIGMSVARIKHCLATCDAAAVVSCKAFLRLRWLIPALRRLPLYSVDSRGWGIRPFTELKLGDNNSKAMPVFDTTAATHALITFTSGSTGLPKAADRNHALLIAQYHSIGKVHTTKPGESCLTCFPVFVLYGLARGLSNILPPVNFRHLSSVNGHLVLSQLQQRRVQYFAAGPAFLNQVADALCKNQQRYELPLAVLAVGGAPVSPRLCRKVIAAFPAETEKNIVYGSTEAEPIAYISMEKSLECGNVNGNIVGPPSADLALNIVNLPADIEYRTIPEINVQQVACTANQVGEIIVKGRQVLSRYFDERDNIRCKIRDENGELWHRIGDLAYRREDSLIVLTGRMGQQVQISGRNVYPLTIETPLATMPSIRYAALLTHPKLHLEVVLCVELENGFQPRQALDHIEQVFVAQGLSLPHQIYRIKLMPVDGRHDSKVDRIALSKYLTRRWLRPLMRINTH